MFYDVGRLRVVVLNRGNEFWGVEAHAATFVKLGGDLAAEFADAPVAFDGFCFVKKAFEGIDDGQKFRYMGERKVSDQFFRREYERLVINAL